MPQPSSFRNRALSPYFDTTLIQNLRQEGLSLRQITARINNDRPKNDRVSFQTIMRTLQ